jgi:hypothetical protein
MAGRGVGVGESLVRHLPNKDPTLWPAGGVGGGEPLAGHYPIKTPHHYGLLWGWGRVASGDARNSALATLIILLKHTVTITMGTLI